MSYDRDDLRPAPDLVEDGIPATVDDPPHLSTDAVEGEPAPLEHPQGVEEWGTTAAEERMGEPFALRVAREEPELLGGDDDGVTGVADALSAEEAALHVEDEPEELGMSFAPDPGYLSDDDR